MAEIRTFIVRIFAGTRSLKPLLIIIDRVRESWWKTVVKEAFFIPSAHCLIIRTSWERKRNEFVHVAKVF